MDWPKRCHYRNWVIRLINKYQNKIVLDFFDFATKSDIKKQQGVDTSKFAKKFELTIILDKIFGKKRETQ